jgi:hypothetical protein
MKNNTLNHCLCLILFVALAQSTTTEWPFVITNSTYDFQVLSFNVNDTNPKMGTNLTFSGVLYVQRSISWWYNQYLNCDILDENGKSSVNPGKTTVNIKTSPYVTKAGDQIPFSYTYHTWISQKYVNCIVQDFGNKVYIQFHAILPAYKQLQIE